MCSIVLFTASTGTKSSRMELLVVSISRLRRLAGEDDTLRWRPSEKNKVYREKQLVDQ